MLAAGWVYQEVFFPVTIPQQVVRLEPPALPAEARFAEARVQRATFDPGTSTLTMDVLATNTGSQPMRLQGFNTSNLAFDTDASATRPNGHQLSVDGPVTIAAGESQTLRLTLPDPAWTSERLIETANPRIEVAGQLVFEDSSGGRTHTTIGSAVIPKLF
jgi:hypothetical protein